MSETPEIRHKRLKMRSWRRGTKEMDLILGPFADQQLISLSDKELDLYELLLEENDQELYPWITTGIDAPANYAGLFELVRTYHGISLKV